ncbi:tetratricopeptide repeat protein [Roseiconus lacunae]|uniref:tetratricopeptide repeat protein n=1 Tax=Roseiconus lacunae TaxID=2605694 RepID=UPI001E569390|nr:tetratricopeptide repeat protein [Roseiconus lacunae]MCD0458149.1 tetratricopeptide repeat protein [Roseiconus lacunae]
MATHATPKALEEMKRGCNLYEQGRLLEARKSFEIALSYQDELSPARFNLAVISRDLEENDKAKRLFMRLLQDGELTADAHNNLGVLSIREQNYAAAESHFRKSVAARHDFPLAHFNLGMVLLRIEEYAEGWEQFEWRWKTALYSSSRQFEPRWDGTYLDGTLHVYAEQGIGDTIQFARYLPYLAERCRRLVFTPLTTMNCLFSFPMGVDRDFEVRANVPGESTADAAEFYDFAMPLMSAPSLLGIAHPLSTGTAKYLRWEKRKLDIESIRWEANELKVGIAWRGSPAHPDDAFRSAPLHFWRDLLLTADVSFYSLQIGNPASELLYSGLPVVDLSKYQQDLADAAELIQKMDLIITVDTCLLHLAATIGLPTWAILSRRCDWRWSTTGKESTPWYESVRLFRQNQLNDWTELLGRVKLALEKLIASKQ